MSTANMNADSAPQAHARYRREFRTAGHPSETDGFEITGHMPNLDGYLTSNGITPLEHFNPIETLVDTGDKAIYVTSIGEFYTGLLVKMIDHSARVERWITWQVDTAQYKALAQHAFARIEALEAAARERNGDHR